MESSIIFTKRDLFLMIFGGNFADRYGGQVIRAVVNPRKSGIYKEDLVEVLGDYIEDENKSSIPSSDGGIIDPDYFSTGKLFQTSSWFFEHHSCVLREENTLRIYKIRRFSLWSNAILASVSMNLSTRILTRLIFFPLDIPDWIQEFVLVIKDTGILTLYNELTGPQRFVFLLSYASMPITIANLVDVKYYMALKYLRATCLQFLASNFRFIDFTAQFRQYCEDDVRHQQSTKYQTEHARRSLPHSKSLLTTPNASKSDEGLFQAIAKKKDHKFYEDY